MTLAIEGITPRVQEIGRIRMGEKGQRGAPVKLKTFRLTSNDRRVLEAAANIYGGRVAEWKDAPDEGMWQLTTEVSELDILIPRSLRSISQSWELWAGGTCERRCDGRIESLSDQPCICGPDRGTGDGFCDILTRISIILPRLPGLGMWRLDTSGFHAATTIPSTVDLLLALDPRPMVPAVLRAVQASSKVRGADGKVVTHRFVRPMLDAPGITIGQLVGAAAEPQLLGEGSASTTPPTAQERAARLRAEHQAARCPELPPDDGEQCARVEGHAELHRNHDGVTWAQPVTEAPSAPEAVVVVSEPTVQSEAAERVAVKRAERVAAPDASCDDVAANGLMEGAVCILPTSHTGAHKSADGSWPA